MLQIMFDVNIFAVRFLSLVKPFMFILPEVSSSQKKVQNVLVK